MQQGRKMPRNADGSPTVAWKIARVCILIGLVVALINRRQLTATLKQSKDWLKSPLVGSAGPVLNFHVGPHVINFELLWMAPFLSGGGYGAEATSFILPFAHSTEIASVRISQHGDGINMGYLKGMPVDQQQIVGGFLKRDGNVSNSVVVCHSEPGAWDPRLFQTSRCPPNGYRGSLYTIGRTMFETDRVTHHHVARINAMDEVWVPTDFHVSTFVASGVYPSKVVKIVEPVDTDFFSPENPDGSRRLPLWLPQGRRVVGPAYVAASKPYVFLSIFKWEPRKAWDVLVTAYLTEFSAADTTVLFILTNSYHSDRKFDNSVAQVALSLKKPAAGWASIYVMDEHVPQKRLPHLYMAADAFVLPSRGEGWGRPHTEAMAMELPVITTNWSGPTEYLTDFNSYPLRYEGLVDVEEGPFKGHLWAEPSSSHLQHLMRHVYDHQEEAKAKGKQARKDMLKYAPEVVNRIVLDRLSEIESKLINAGKLPAKVRLEKAKVEKSRTHETLDL